MGSRRFRLGCGHDQRVYFPNTDPGENDHVICDTCTRGNLLRHREVSQRVSAFGAGDAYQYVVAVSLAPNGARVEYDGAPHPMWSLLYPSLFDGTES